MVLYYYTFPAFSSLFLKKVIFLQRIGIIAEFNPLHNGHKYLIDLAKQLGEVVCVISSNFVQRGETALCEKRLRAKMAIENGADLVLEMPVVFSMSTAQNFALGGVSALAAVGCDTLFFGSETGEIEPLLKVCDILESEAFKERLASYLKEGITFAKARQIAAEECGAPKGVLEGANNNLGIEYILAARAIGAEMQFKTVKRQGVLHDSEKAENGFASASLIREKILSGDYEFAKNYIPQNVLSLLGDNNISDIRRIERAVLAVLRTKTIEQLRTLPDISEGIENKLYNAIKNAETLNQLYEKLKVKRYTLARIRRLVLSAFIGIDNTFFMKTLPYVRILGFNKIGETIIKTAKKEFKIPIVMRVGEIDALGDKAQKLFKTESLATDLYNLSLNPIGACGLEYTSKLIIKKI